MNGKSGLFTTLVAVGVGGALMYWFDPDAGKRRRAQTRVTSRRVAADVQRAIDRSSRSLERLSNMDWRDVAKALIPIAATALLRR